MIICATILLAASTLSAMEEVQTTEAVWKQYQVLGALTETQQKALVTLAGKSKSARVTDFVAGVEKVQADTDTIIKGLDSAKDTRQGRGQKILRALTSWIWCTDVDLLAELEGTDTEGLLDQLSILSTASEKQLAEMVAQATYSKTKGIEELTTRFEKIKENLGTFLVALRQIQTQRASAQKNAEEQSKKTVKVIKEEEKKQDKLDKGGDCVIC